MQQKITIYCLSLILVLIPFSCSLLNNSSSKNQLLLYGNVDVRQVQLGFRVSGRVLTMPFEEGDLVKPMSLMASLDKRPYIDKVNEAKADVERAQYELINTEEILLRRTALRGTGAISDENYTDALSNRNIAKAAFDQAEAILSTALTNLHDTDIFAPTEGTILTRIREPGTVVNVSDPIYSLSVLSPVWIRAYVTEPELGLIFPGMEAEITTDTPGGKTYKGHIGFISPVAEFTPKTVQTTTLRPDLVYRLRIIADNPDYSLKQGMPVTVRLIIPSGDTPK